MAKTLFYLVSVLIFFIFCSKEITEPIEQPESNIIGKIVDKASGQGLTGTSVKIVNDQNAYHTSTGGGGSFSFQNIQNGEYSLSTETIQNGEVLSDTCGIFNTNTPDWGTIYSNTFASITGSVRLEGEDDHSFINIQLLGTDKSALTTNQGNFRIDFIFPDKYDLFISINEEYQSYHIKDVELIAGEEFVVDTLLSYKFRPLELADATEINLPYLPVSGFAYADGKYYYGKSILGLYEYDPVSEEEKLVFSHYYLGDPAVVYDYTDGIWMSGDQATQLMHRKYSITQNSIVDFLLAANSFFSYQASIAWDPLNNYLVGHSYGTDIYLFSLQSNQLTTVSPTLEYDPNLYSSIHFNEIIVDEIGLVYVIVRYTPNSGEIQNHLYVFNNTTDLETVKIYKFQQQLPNYQKLSYKDGNLYLTLSNKIYQLLL